MIRTVIPVRNAGTKAGIKARCCGESVSITIKFARQMTIVGGGGELCGTIVRIFVYRFTDHDTIMQETYFNR